jgi:hypothetical protein
MGLLRRLAATRREIRRAAPPRQSRNPAAELTLFDEEQRREDRVRRGAYLERVTA